MSVSNTPEALSAPFRYFLPLAAVRRRAEIGGTDSKKNGL